MINLVRYYRLCCGKLETVANGYLAEKLFLKLLKKTQWSQGLADFFSVPGK